MVTRCPYVFGALLWVASLAPAQLAPGTYTIDPAGSGPLNYPTWAAAVPAVAVRKRASAAARSPGRIMAPP